VHTTIDAAAVTALADLPVDAGCKSMPDAWIGQTPAAICAGTPELFDAGALGPVCVLHEDALTHNLATMARWCTAHGVQLAPHGKTHMSPQLLARQVAAGACAVTVATIGQARLYRAFGVSTIMLANELVDAAGLRWLAGELNRDPDFRLFCWADSVRGVDLMSAALCAAGTRRPVDVCVEVGVAGGRTGVRTADEVDAVARAVVDSAGLRLVGIAGYEGGLGHDVSPAARTRVADYLHTMRTAVLRLLDEFETEDIIVTAGGSTHFDLVADVLAGDWPARRTVETIVRSGCYLTHDDGLYARTTPLGPAAFRPALTVWAQVCSTPEPDLALLTMGRRDVPFDQDLPAPRTLPAGNVVKLNDQHAFLRPGPGAQVRVGDWLEFGVSHPCTLFDKWRLIPVLDADGRTVELIRTFF
jgi:D-serine deaminase-like pyridoxal phosphate-dependent protein